MNFQCGYCDHSYDVSDLKWYPCCGCYLCEGCQQVHLDHWGTGDAE
jgi:hypothetical protein